MKCRNRKGVLYGVGVGPGDRELITLKAHRLISNAKVIAYPAPDDGESFARSIVAPFLGKDQEEIAIVIPMSVERFPAVKVYDEAAEKIAAHLSAGHDVVVVCEGDPFFYGSFMYLFERLSGRFECEIVPGISSLMASSAALKRPLAARNDVMSVIPAPLESEKVRQQIKASDAIAIIKVGRHFQRIREIIEELGLSGCAGYLERVSLENQQVIPLGEVEQDAAPYFSIILIYKGAEKWILAEKVPTQLIDGVEK